MSSYNYNSWLQCETSGYGKGSFGIITYTTNIKTDNYYYYDVYLITNSYYKNGTICSSYIKNIKVILDRTSRNNDHNANGNITPIHNSLNIPTSIDTTRNRNIINNGINLNN